MKDMRNLRREMFVGGRKRDVFESCFVEEMAWKLVLKDVDT